jgi:hypothetical protein
MKFKIQDSRFKIQDLTIEPNGSYAKENYSDLPVCSLRQM